MKRFLILLATVGLCAIATAEADDAVRQAQERLKSGGFFFGEVNGSPGSETSAAITRYQIRNGLPITGQLDAETMKSLGVRGAPAAQADAPAQSQGETWRRLRKPDEQFLRRAAATEKPTAKVANKPAPPAQTEPQPQTRDTTTFILSRERLRDYVAAFVLAGLDPRVGQELEFFADRVNYYDRGTIPREEIRRDLQRYNERWPNRRFWLAGNVDVQPQPDSLLRVTFPLRYELRSPKERASGTVRKTLLVEVTGDDLQIVGVNERKGR